MWHLPPVDEIDAGLPVFGRTLATLAGALNHLQGWHCRGFAASDVWQGGQLTPGDSDDVGYILRQPEAHGEMAIPYYVSTGVEWVHVVLHVLSRAAGGATTPRVRVRVETASEVVIDDGVEWDRGSGTLPGSEDATRAGTPLLLPFRVESSESTVGDPTPGVPTAPRRLYVGSEVGSIVIVRAVTERARIVGVHIIPEPLVTL